MNNYKTNDLVLAFIKDKGIDEVQLGAEIGKNPSTIYRITGKKTVPSKTTLKLIADAYGFDVSYFKTGKMVKLKSESADTTKELRDLRGKVDELLMLVYRMASGTGKYNRSGMAA